MSNGSKRNNPCPCGSGKKFKRCCLGKHVGSPPLPFDEAEIAFRRLVYEQSRRRNELLTRRYGHVRPIISNDVDGYKFVAVGSQLLYSKKWRTFTDFLVAYLAGVVGHEWANAEIAKPPDSRHWIVKLYQQWCAFQRTGLEEKDGVYTGKATGPAKAFLNLAYDLYLLRHHNALQTSFLDRLKHREQFQGVRYELAIATTFIRAGYDLVYEDDTDGSSGHAEFVAKHRTSMFEIAVEAKSRHRPGVLDFPGATKSEESLTPGIRRILRQALSKPTRHPLVAFVDVNLPPVTTQEQLALRAKEIRRDVGGLLNGLAQGTTLVNLVLVTNLPNHYGDPDKLAAALECWHFQYLKAARAIPQNLIKGILDAVAGYGRIPQHFEE